MRRRDQRGTAATEMGVVLLPLLLPILAGIVDLGLAIVIRSQMQEAAQEGAAIAARMPDQPSRARLRAKETVSIVALKDNDIDITCVGGEPRITVTHVHKTIILKLVIPNDMTIQTTMTSGRLSTETCKELVT